MKTSLCLAVPLLLASGGAVAAVDSTPARTVPLAAHQDAYDQLHAEFAADLAEWEQALEDARNAKEREKLQKKSPYQSYWRKFSRLKGKDGRAVLWMLQAAEHQDLKPKKLKDTREKLTEELLEDHLDKPWIGGFLNVLYEAKDSYGAERLEGIYAQVIESNDDPGVLSHAKYRTAWILKRRGGAENETAAEELFVELANDYRRTRYGTLAAARVADSSDIAEGEPAPDFFARTLDGHEFCLSDYEGKVVLLDFYGFW